MNKIEDQILLNALPGASDHGQGLVTFALYAPAKKTVRLSGSFNNWNPAQDMLTEVEPVLGD